jgi:ribose 5-phosphate isomerase A
MNVENNDLLIIVKNFYNIIKENDVIAVGSFNKDKLFIEELIKLLSLDKKKVYFVPTTNKQAIYIDQLDQETISLSDKEIDLAIEFVEQLDQYNNFIKKDTKSFIRDKMISQSAYKLVVVVEDNNLVELLNKDVYVEISSFAWKRTLFNLQSYGVSRIVSRMDGSFVKTEMRHYLARVTIDSKISLEDFEYSVRNIPGVLETGLFLGLADIIFVYNKDAKKDNLILKQKR